MKKYSETKGGKNLLKAIEKDTCNYLEIGFIENHNRVKYKSACGIDVVKMDYEVWNGMEHIKNPLSGKCMKCKKEITIKKAVAGENNEKV